MKNTTPKLVTLSSGSHSRLVLFEQCKFRTYLKHALRIPEPERPLPPGKTEHANDRGSRLHENGELFVRGKAKLAPELRKHFAQEFESLRAHFLEKRVLLEDEWAMDREWEAVKWDSPEAWLRLKLDAMVTLDGKRVVVIDYKTGRREGNEIKHAEQMQLYQLVTFLRYPYVEEVTVELWYVDIDDLYSQTYMRDQGLRFKKRFHERLMNLTTYQFTGDPKIEANPSMFTCRYCPYGQPTSTQPQRTGHCPRG